MTDRHLHLDGRAVALILLCVALWGLNQVAAKLALAEIPPLMQAAARSLGAAVLLLAWSRWRGIALAARDGTALPGLVAGLLFAVEFGCIFVGLQYTGASRMVVFVFAAPFFVALGMPFVAPAERLDGWQIGGLVGAFAALAWALLGGLADSAAVPGQWLGDALGLLAGALWGLTTLVIRATRLATATPEKTLLAQLLVSGLALAAASALAGEPWPDTLSVVSLGPLAFQTVVVTFASYLLWFWLLRHYPATQLSAFTLLTPVFGLLAGVALLGEPATPRLLVALFAISCGIALVNRIGRRRANKG